MMDYITFSQEVCGNLEQALEKEWLETNGLGGYASSTIINANTRRYHGLLVVATKPPVGRYVLFSNLEESIEIGTRKYFLSTHLYPGTIHPHGFENLVDFRIDPFPIFTYRLGEVLLEKTILMLYGENSVIITYKVSLPEEPIKLELKPLIAFRDFHSLMKENENVNTSLATKKGMVMVAPYGELPPLYFHHDAVVLDKSGYWYKDFEYPQELARGYDFQEDLYNPFSLVYSFLHKDQVYLCASTTYKEIFNLENVVRSEKARRLQATINTLASTKALRLLIRNADSFIVEGREGQKSVIAGYHWFSDWGRDTMIALPGLTLVTGKYEIAKNILLAYSQYVSQGMIPNRMPEGGEEPEYNTVDASLWYINAIFEYWQYSEDWETVQRKFYPVMKKIIKFYQEGTRFNIHMDKDGLIYAGQKGWQLTWMDAKIEDRLVTPRQGKAVEINALWYNALMIMAELALRCGEKTEREVFKELAERVRVNFNQSFWDEKEDYLYDCITEDKLDKSLRPNQIFSISLPFPVLEASRWKNVLKHVEQELLTPFGLRTLSPHHPDYRGSYQGNQAKRDAAYHQGTVWPWLMGPFVTAYLRAFGDSKQVKAKLGGPLNCLLEHLEQAGLGTVSEIFDGDPPHLPRGCIAQAWSVAELLRAVEKLNPEFFSTSKLKEKFLRKVKNFILRALSPKPEFLRSLQNFHRALLRFLFSEI